MVLIDDRLPCGADGLPCFGHNPSPVVLWMALIEKAFAKFKGSYENMNGGSVEDGLLYLTGGVCVHTCPACTCARTCAGLSREVGIHHACTHILARTSARTCARTCAGLSREVGIAASADKDVVDAMWDQMSEWWRTSHAIGCEHRIDGEASPELRATGESLG